MGDIEDKKFNDTASASDNNSSNHGISFNKDMMLEDTPLKDILIRDPLLNEVITVGTSLEDTLEKVVWLEDTSPYTDTRFDGIGTLYTLPNGDIPFKDAGNLYTRRQLTGRCFVSKANHKETTTRGDC